jgi:uncharacterized membrane protein
MHQFGAVVGWAFLDTQDMVGHAYVYFDGKTKDLGVLPGGYYSMAFGINHLGQIVGGSIQAGKYIHDSTGKIVGYTPSFEHGFVTINGKMRDLNGLINNTGSAFEINEARSINDRGQILANASFPGKGGTDHAVLLTLHTILPAMIP